LALGERIITKNNIMSIFEWLDENLKGFSDFLKNYIQPFLTPFFAATAYFSLTAVIKDVTNF
jgi:type III secretory pathway component EscR